MDFRCETLAIGIEEGLEGQDPSLAVQQPPRRAINSEGKLDMRDANKVWAQIEYCCGGGETAAEMTAVAVAEFYVVHCCMA